MSEHKSIKEMISIWRAGCSCASKEHPWECQECTVGLIEAIEKSVEQVGIVPEFPLLIRASREFYNAHLDLASTIPRAEALGLVNRLSNYLQETAERLTEEWRTTGHLQGLIRRLFETPSVINGEHEAQCSTDGSGESCDCIYGDIRDMAGKAT